MCSIACMTLTQTDCYCICMCTYINRPTQIHRGRDRHRGSDLHRDTWNIHVYIWRENARHSFSVVLAIDLLAVNII